MKSLTLELDDELHHKFKVHCAESKLSMKDRLIISIKQILKKN